MLFNLQDNAAICAVQVPGTILRGLASNAPLQERHALNVVTILSMANATDGAPWAALGDLGRIARACC